MYRLLLLAGLWLVCSGQIHAHGLLIPEEKNVPPLAMVNHRVGITLDDQVAVTRVEQTFRNHTDRQLEATYVFPVPKGASVNRFTMWVNDKEVGGELVEAAKARQIYTDIVRRTQDPGLLEYMGNNLFRMRVFPIMPRSNQKVAMTFTSVSHRDASTVEYTYPLKTDGKATATLEELSIQATIKSQQPIQNIYSPTHAITVTRPGDRQAVVKFDRNQGLLDKDFQLFYSTSSKDIGFSTLLHRPVQSDKGYFMLLISPRLEASKTVVIPRDMVFVLDTSGSMRGPKMDQARRSLKYCLSQLSKDDRFAVLNFATTVNAYKEALVQTSSDEIEHAKKWVDQLEATGGTAINDALLAALNMRSTESSRTFTIVFFTDGQPTIGETDVEKIKRNVLARNSANTRIFTFGVGDDVHATFLDEVAERTRAVSTYVRPAEDIEAKVSGLYSKISNPILSNLRLTASKDIRFEEIYPPQLPDLFHGGQLVVLGRYSGQGHAAVTLAGSVGSDGKEFVYETDFAAKTSDERSFVEHLWARRKVGYLLDQIRANGEKRELIEETVALAKKYGIATPYTSYLIVPDAPVPVADSRGGRPGQGRGGMAMMAGIGGGLGGLGGGIGAPGGGAKLAPATSLEFAKAAQKRPGELAASRSRLEDARTREVDRLSAAGAAGKELEALKEAGDKKRAYDVARESLLYRRNAEVQTGKLGVDLAVMACELRTECRLKQTAVRHVSGRNCMELGGVWIDEGFTAKTPHVVVKCMSEAYFRILELRPEVKDVFKLGNHLVWITPSSTALVIDTNAGTDKLSDAEIHRLFLARK